MPDYRAYIVGSDGHFRSFEIDVAADDEAALKIADKLADEHDIELWELGRKVAVLPRKDQNVGI